MCHSERMTDDELSRLSEICEAATAGPWAWETWEDRDSHVYQIDGDEDYVQAIMGTAYDVRPDEDELRTDQNNCAFIAAARTAMPRLLAEVKALRSVLERVEWCNGYRNLTHECPICGNDQHEGHDSTCQLAAALGRRTTD